jgi:L-serine dehydratase
MNLFDIMGPIMVGPSSSHTAGAVRIGLITRKLLGEPVLDAEMLLHGSFAATGEGHGTDRALVAGLLGMKPDNVKIPASFEIAKQKGMKFTMGTVVLRGVHPNTAMLRVREKAVNDWRSLPHPSAAEKSASAGLMELKQTFPATALL